MNNELSSKLINSVGKNEANGEYYLKDVKQASLSKSHEMIGNGTHTCHIGVSGTNTIVTGVLILANGNAGEAEVKNNESVVIKEYISKFSNAGASSIHQSELEGTITLVVTGAGSTDKTFFGVSYITEVV